MGGIPTLFIIKIAIDNLAQRDDNLLCSPPGYTMLWSNKVCMRVL